MNADGHREILGPQVTSAEDGSGWPASFHDLTARGLTGVALVTSDAHSGLASAIGATLPGAAWQRCRTHYAADLMAATPKASWPRVRALLHSVHPAGRLNREICRRTDVVGVLPDRHSPIRLVGAVLAEQHDDWIEGRRTSASTSSPAAASDR